MMDSNSVENENGNTEDARLSDISADSSSALTSGVSHRFDILICSTCSKDVTSEPTSVNCDFDSCHHIFHPCCLGDAGPLDNEKWYCDKHDPSEREELCGRCKKGFGCDKCGQWFHSIIASVLMYQRNNLNILTTLKQPTHGNVKNVQRLHTLSLTNSSGDVWMVRTRS
jgi:hypothetical protein